jgi:hypothetical protein
MTKISKEYRDKWNAMRSAEGKCSACHKRFPKDARAKQCEDCKAKRKARDNARYAAGLCGCGAPRQTKAKCLNCAQRTKKWMDNPENKRRWSERVTEKNRARRIFVLSHYGGKCACCGESEMPFLTLDHIHNDGKVDREKVHAGYWWRWIVKHGFPSHLQVLCWNCNMAKQHYGNGVCPHKIKPPTSIPVQAP